MFVDALIIFVIIAERSLRLISLSESLETGPAQLEDRGQEPGGLQWGLPIYPGPEFILCPQGGLGGSRKIEWPLGQHFL